MALKLEHPSRTQTARDRSVRRFRASLLVPVALALLSLGIRLWDVTFPPETYWDENYYAIDASGYLGQVLPLPERPPAPTIGSEVSWEHPPLGKWIIAAGVSPFGLRPLGYRLPSVLFGTAGVLLLYALALELWGSVWWAGFAGLLLSLDGLDIVQSRIAMLDVFLLTFVTAGALFLVRDRRRMLDRPSGPPRGRIERWFSSRDRLLAGAMFGAAVATKWSGGFALLLAVALTASWVRRERSSDRSQQRRPWRSVALAFVAVPLAIYLVSYVEFFVQHPFGFGAFLHLQWAMLQKQLHGPVRQARDSSAWTWPLLLHPIRYYPGHLAGFNGSTTRWIVAVGNPVFFGTFLLALPLALVNAIRRADPAARLALSFYAAMYLPWLFFSRAAFIYYIVPCLPFMALAIVSALRSLGPTIGRRVTALVLVADVGAAAAFMPVWLGLPGASSVMRALHLLPGWPR